jgi:hypothetical protein
MMISSGIVAIASLSTWHLYIARPGIFSNEIIIATLVIVVCLLLMNNFFQVEAINDQKKRSAGKIAELEKLQRQAE